jgi:hypothetical protein
MVSFGTDRQETAEIGHLSRQYREPRRVTLCRPHRPAGAMKLERSTPIAAIYIMRDERYRVL